MNNSQKSQPSPGISLGDIYYVLFRHKWKIIVLSLLGFTASGVLYHLKAPPFQSSANLLIQYVSQARSLTVGDGSSIVVPDSGGAGVISAELQILTSLDVLQDAATNIGPAKILAKFGGGDNALAAACVIQSGLEASPADRDSGIIIVTYKHPDPLLVQPILLAVINAYLEKHREIHSTVGQYDDVLSKEGSTLKAQVEDTEKKLSALKSKANIISLDNSLNNVASQIARIQGSILDVQADLAGYEAVMRQLRAATPDKPETASTPPPVIPPDQIDAYNDASARLNVYLNQKQGYLVQGFTRNNVLVQEVDKLIADVARTKTSLEEKYPELGGGTSGSPSSGGQAGSAAVDLQTQKVQVAILQAKLKTWNTQLLQLQIQATNLNALAPIITQLEQTKAIQEQNYQNLATKLENSHIDEALDNGKTPNIKWIQTPTPPYQDWKKIKKKAGMVAFCGIMAGIAWAFLIELYLDRSVRRPSDILIKLKLPLFLTVPDVNRNGHTRAAKASQQRQLASSDDAKKGKALPRTDGLVADPASTVQLVSLEQNPSLKPFYQALRDRLIVYFEVKKLTHKPKMVAVTSANKGAGVSSMAAGLAASLSETGEGNVLLVDMNLEFGAAQHFYKGQAMFGLDTALEKETRQKALVQDNLYVVTGESKNYELSKILPKRFAALVPKFEASEYDYIIFDMPPVSQTSITSRLARFMDMILLVVESEKTNREVVQQVNNWLGESGATVGAVLNKTRKYIPDRVRHDFNSDV